jgi:hypothetical protein
MDDGVVARLGPLGNRRPRAFSRYSHHQTRIGFWKSLTCGRYRLSRRKSLIVEYFDTPMVSIGNLATTSHAQAVGIIRQNPSKAERYFSLALGSAFLGKRRQYWLQHHQCAHVLSGKSS